MMLSCIKVITYFSRSEHNFFLAFLQGKIRHFNIICKNGTKSFLFTSCQQNCNKKTYFLLVIECSGENKSVHSKGRHEKCNSVMKGYCLKFNYLSVIMCDNRLQLCYRKRLLMEIRSLFDNKKCLVKHVSVVQLYLLNKDE